jgi:uncharacterized protein
MSKMNSYYLSPTFGKMSVNEVVNQISDYIKSEPASYYRLIIGSDSQLKNGNGEACINYVTAIIVYRKGKGARYYWKNTQIQGKTVLRDKIYNETLLSLNTAQEIVPKIRKFVSPGKYDFEIHIDVGPLGPTREMIREVVGMVNGNGFVAKTKPDSWGASSVADKHT